MSESQSTQIILLRDILLIGVKKFLLLKKIKNTVPWTYEISNLNGENILGSFNEKELQKTLIRKNLELKKLLKEKDTVCQMERI